MECAMPQDLATLPGGMLCLARVEVACSIKQGSDGTLVALFILVVFDIEFSLSNTLLSLPISFCVGCTYTSPSGAPGPAGECTCQSCCLALA